MTDIPCGDITCHCCYPDLACRHDDVPTEMSDGEVVECPGCGTRWLAIGLESMTAEQVARLEWQWDLMAQPIIRRGLTPPPKYTHSLRRLNGPTTIRGSA